LEAEKFLLDMLVRVGTAQSVAPIVKSTLANFPSAPAPSGGSSYQNFRPTERVMETANTNTQQQSAPTSEPIDRGPG
jgi:hypothetical protein